LIARDWLNARALSLFFDLQLRRVLVLGGKDRKRVVRENIAYATGQGRRLDVYFAVHDALNQGGSERAVEEDERPLTPVVVFYGGGNWTWWRRKMAAQAALRLRRLGFTVVAPELRQWSAAKTPEMVSLRGGSQDARRRH
jgi:acetyl esterase/lipase